MAVKHPPLPEGSTVDLRGPRGGVLVVTAPDGLVVRLPAPRGVATLWLPQVGEWSWRWGDDGPSGTLTVVAAEADAEQAEESEAPVRTAEVALGPVKLEQVTIVTQLRRLVGASTTEYTAGGETFWTDDQLQTVLDRHVSNRLIQARLELIPSFTGNGNLQFVDGRIPGNGTLDPASVTVTSFDGGAIPGAYTAERDGRITFTDDQISTIPVASALWYDLNAAAADVLATWASAVKLGYDVKTDGQEMSRSQRHKQLLDQAREYRRQSLPGTVSLDRRRGGQRGGTLAQALMAAWPYLGQRGGTRGG